MFVKTPLRYALLSGVFLLFDRFLKWQALHSWGDSVPFGKYIGWEPFMNDGIAFGIRLPVVFVIAFTLFIIGAIIYFFQLHLKLKDGRVNTAEGVGLMLILAGALSNLADRIIYQQTVDYFRIFTSVINLADCLIIVGFVLYFGALKHLK